MIITKFQIIIDMGNRSVVKRSYYRLFYFFYRIEKRGRCWNEESERFLTFMAIIPLAYLGFKDLMTLEYLFSRFVFDLNISQSFAYPLLLGLISSVFNGVFFFRKRRYLEIEEMFSKEDHDTRFFRSFVCVIYSLATMFVPTVLIAIFGYPK